MKDTANTYFTRFCLGQRVYFLAAKRTKARIRLGWIDRICLSNHSGEYYDITVKEYPNVKDRDVKNIVYNVPKYKIYLSTEEAEAAIAKGTDSGVDI